MKIPNMTMVGSLLLAGPLLAGQVIPLSRAMDFTKGDKPDAQAGSYALRWQGVSGIPNGLAEKGADARQIYVSKIADPATTQGKLVVGDVILGVNGHPFDGNVIDTFRMAVDDAPLRDKEGTFDMLVWRNGQQSTQVFRTLPPPPDLTQSFDTGGIHDWTLGPTGARGWLFSRGLDTTDARQIRVTQIAAGSPADGLLELNDVIIGINGQPFASDARRAFGEAITAAESTENQGRLSLLCWRKGKQIEVTLSLPVMGSYSATSPYHCPKAQRLLDEGCRAILKAGIPKGIPGNINALALLASGKPEYLPVVKQYAHHIASLDSNVKLGEGMLAWSWGFDNLFLTEYYLATQDATVLPAIRSLTVNIATGQGATGTWGHGMRITGNNGTLGGYGAINQSGLVCWLSLVLGEKCGINEPVVTAAIDQSRQFFGFYVGKGSIPYGDHPPYSLLHDDNGKSASAAITFDLIGDATATPFFSRLATAAYGEKEFGHTGNYFSYLWGALGASRAGPEATAAYLRELRWYYDLARGWNGRSVYQGKAGQPTAGSAEHQYGGWDMTGLFVLHEALPLKQLYITGKEATLLHPLTGKDLQDVMSYGKGFTYGPADFVYAAMTPEALLQALTSWSPVVRQRAATALTKRPDDVVPQLIVMLKSADLNTCYGACLALQYLEGRAAGATDALIPLLAANDMWLRTRASFALSGIGKPARKAVPAMLKLAQAVNPNDPRAMESKYLSFALFRSRYIDNVPRTKGLLVDSVEGVDRDLLYPTIKHLLRSDDGLTGYAMLSIFNTLTTEELKTMLPDIIKVAHDTQPSGEMFAQDIRVAAFQFLAKNKIEAGLPAFIEYFKTQNGWGCKTTELLPLLKEYGAAARPILPQLQELQASWQAHDNGAAGPSRAAIAAEVIKAIQADALP